jgi:DNA-binding transcriptional MerR regulator
MKMSKQRFRIGQLANNLNVESFVIRFWEKEFNIKAIRSEGGQRFYDQKHLSAFQKIKELLYDKKFTIAGAKEALKQEKSYAVAEKTTMENDHIEVISEQKFLSTMSELIDLQKKLIKLRDVL